MTLVDPVVSALTELGPLSSFELCQKIWQRSRVGKNATSKRLERLFKNGKIGRYLRLERGAYLYYLPNLHSEELLQKTARNLVTKHSRLLARVLAAVTTGKVLCVFELGRITNIKFFTYDEKINPRLDDIISKIKKLGIRIEDSFLISPSVPESEIRKLIARYEATISEEAHLLAFTRRLFITTKRAQEMTLYREPRITSIAQHKFDMFGHGGRRNQIKIVVECNLRRKVTTADLEGFSQRIGGTVKKSMTQRRYSAPIARYFIANNFSSEARAFAARRDKGIRLLHVEPILNGVLEETQPYEMVSKKRPIYYGRFKEVKGIAFEAEIEPAYKQKGFSTTRRKLFFLDGNKVTDEETGRSLTDIDLFAEHKNDYNEILLIECKSGIEKLTRTELFKKTKKYFRVASFLERGDANNKVKIVVIANVDETDREELRTKSKFDMEFITPRQFYRKNREPLKGATRWLFGLEKLKKDATSIREINAILSSAK